MATKSITLNLDEDLVKAFEDKYGDTEAWLTGEFDWRARQSKKEIIETKVGQLLTSAEVTQIPGTEAEILEAYYADKTEETGEE